MGLLQQRNLTYVVSQMVVTTTKMIAGSQDQRAPDLKITQKGSTFKSHIELSGEAVANIGNSITGAFGCEVCQDPSTFEAKIKADQKSTVNEGNTLNGKST
ncbi:hypothetical protein F4803DRAFT_544771 [Xylaria telfairii]|nr:hypothetical protein F4803DRAFT_544771 [Xylaria telfairii]